jgi:SOS regulatory protein LexA
MEEKRSTDTAQKSIAAFFRESRPVLSYGMFVSVLSIPLLGWIQAGWPSPEEEALCDIISLDEYLITRPESSFLLRVSGDSMTGAGILAGDLVIVEKGRVPKDGDVVIAQVDGEWTMKHFRKQGKEISLEPANPQYQVIRPQRELRIGGIVSAVIRKYHL